MLDHTVTSICYYNGAWGTGDVPLMTSATNAAWLANAVFDGARAFESIAFPAIAEHHISLGLGWAATPTLALNAGFTYSPKAKLSGSNAAEQGLVSYETTMSQFAADLGVGWKF